MDENVVIIGAGVSGLTLAAFLQNSGVSCIVLERRDRAYIQLRQRAGVVEARGVQMFERWGLADRHQMNDWLSGVYIKPFGKGKSSVASYEVSQPHRHDFYYCVLLEKGEIELEVDFQKIRLQDQSLFFSYPGQIHQINTARLEKGWFLAFDPALMDERLKSMLDQSLSDVILLPLPEGLYVFVHHLYAVYEDTNHLFHQTIIQSLVTAFGYQVAAAYLSKEQHSLSRHSTRNIEITKTFRQLLRHHFKSMKKPSEYAAKMNITASYLNDTVKAVTGFPVTYYIQQALMREAQRLLFYSDLTVKE